MVDFLPPAGGCSCLAQPGLDTDLILIVSHLVTVPASHRMLQKRLHTRVEVAKLATAAAQSIGQTSSRLKSVWQFFNAIHVYNFRHSSASLVYNICGMLRRPDTTQHPVKRF